MLSYKEFLFNSKEEILKFLENDMVKILNNYNIELKLFDLAIVESLTNSLKHGKMPVEVTFMENKSKILVKIKDSGNGFNFKEKLDLIGRKGTQKLLEEKSEELAISGRGIYIIFEICDKVEFNSIGNEITLFKSKSKSKYKYKY